MTILLIIIGLILAVVAILLYTAPSNFRVERKITINAAPAKIFPYLDDLRQGREWSPFEKLDPHMERTYSGAASGVGAKYEWSSQSNRAGAGSLEIIDCDADKLVGIKMQSFRPMKGTSEIHYKLTPKEGGVTEIAWSITGPLGLVPKIICLFVSMDKMMGTVLATGLADLKKLIENG